MYAGNINNDPISRIAERAIEVAAIKKRQPTMAVALYPNGRVEVQKNDDADERARVAAITRKSDPDWLAEELEFAWRKMTS